MKAIISGAGIAGPAMALELKKIGFNPVVFEARQENEMSGGIFLGITPNGLNVLKRWIDLDVLKEDFTPGKMVFCNAKNKPIGELDTKQQLEMYGAETMQVKRAAISHALRNEAVAQGIDINYGYQLESFTQNNNGVNAKFANGEEHCANFLIGCDGTHSTCRKLLFPDAPKAVYTKQLSTGAMINMNGKRPEYGNINMVFGKQAFFAFAVSNKDEVWWFNNFYREDEPTKEEIKTTLQQEIKAHLLKIHKDDPDIILTIIAHSDNIFAYPVYEIPSLSRWFKGNVCLLGDAAHATAPHIGQGASMALEDTVVLAESIKKNKDLPGAFKDFQEVRKPRVEKLIKTARKIGNNKSKPGAVATFFRDLLLRYFIKLEIKKMDWVYRYKP